MAQGNASGGKSSRPRKSGGAAPRKTPPPARGLNLTPAQQEQIVAASLLVIAVLTALGAFNLSSGNVLDSWTRVLSTLFGWGRFLAPFFFAGFGLWLLLDSLDMRPDIGWERPLALIIFFFCIESFLHIVAVDFMLLSKTSMEAAQIGLGGGLVGHGVYSLLVGGLGLAGALLVLVVLFGIGLILFFNISLPQIFRALGDGWHQVTALFARASDVKITRNGKTVAPNETTATQNKKKQERLPGEQAPRLPADFGMDELIVEEQPARGSLSARIVGGGARLRR